MSEHISLREASRRLGISTGNISYWIAKGWVIPIDRPQYPGGELVLDWPQVERLAYERQDRRHHRRTVAGAAKATASVKRNPPPGSTDSGALRGPQASSGSPVRAVAPPPFVAVRPPFGLPPRRPEEPPADLVLPYQVELPAEAAWGPAPYPRTLAAPVLADEWLAELANAGLSSRTLEAYGQDVHELAADVATLPCERRQVSAHLGRLAGRLAPISVYRHFTSIRAFLLWARDVHQVPPPVLRRLFRKPRSAPPVFLVEEECAQLLEAMRTRPDHVMVQLLISTGMRAGELCSLRRQGVRAAFVLVAGKTGEHRYPVSDELRRELLDLGPSWVFAGARGGQLSPDGVYRRVRAGMDRAGIAAAKRGPHVLRHTAGYLSIKYSHDLRYVQELLGHATLAMTQKYTQLAVGSVQELHRRYDPLQYIPQQV